jgi:alcohol dehydrogenase, propanol-preferring
MGTPPTMKAMVLDRPGTPLQLRQVPLPVPADGQVLLRVHACGVCRTDLHIVDGDLTEANLPLIPGHQIVGTVVKAGSMVQRFGPGARVGVPWLGGADGTCRFCRQSRENLCDHPVLTGYTIDGGFAEYALADAAFCHALHEYPDDIQAAPLLCAGLIGYRTYRMAGDDVERLGIYGFGAAAHIVAQIAVHQRKKVYAFTRPGDVAGQAFARSLGAVWAGDSTAVPPQPLDAALVFAPVGALVPLALHAVDKGGVVVCGGIHMSDIPSFPYRLLWQERVLRSVANLTRRDGEDLLAIAPRVPICTQVQVFPLEQANQALSAIRSGRLEGAAVLDIRG